MKCLKGFSEVDRQGRWRMRFDTIRGLVLIIVLAAALGSSGCGSAPTTPPTSPPPPPPPPAVTVTVTPATATLYRGDTQRFAARVSGQNDQTVTWSVPVNRGSIDSTGLYTAPSDFDGDVVPVTATSKTVTTASGTSAVTLPAVTFSIAPSAIAVAPGTNRTFRATLQGLNSSQVLWTIQGASGGSITSAGVYTAPSTTGIYQVVATSSANANYQMTASVLVTTTPSSFSPTGNPQSGRGFHTATLLANGKTLVAGGFVFEAYCYAGGDTAELYDPGSGTFATTGMMTNRRYAQTATRLQNGEVLLAGGFSFDPTACLNDGTSPALTSAELFNATNGSFSSTGGMAEERGGHTATLLPSGKVLIAGGGKTGGTGAPFFGDGLTSAEIYNPANGAFTSTGNLDAGRVGHTATLMGTGKVLIAGGVSSSLAGSVATAELYDPVTGTFTATGSMKTARAAHTATMLQDGRVIITGGFSGPASAPVKSAEIYDPATGSFSTTGSMTLARSLHTATLLPNGTVLVVGGGSQFAEIYDSSTGIFFLSVLNESDRSGHSATLLQNGEVLVIGGYQFPDTAELYP